MITPGERRELRSVVRAQFKVLRAEIDQRRAELKSQAAEQVRRRFAESDKTVDDVNWRVGQIVNQANKDIRAVVETARGTTDEGRWTWTGRLHAPHITFAREDRSALQNALTAGVDAQAKAALLTLERQEADLLSQLAMGSLESEEARAFLRSIPTVSELVPATRLAELEAAFDREQGGQRWGLTAG